MRLQIEPLADHPPKELLHLDDEGIEVDHLRLEDLFPAEGEQLPGERRGLLARFANQFRVLLSRANCCSFASRSTPHSR